MSAEQWNQYGYVVVIHQDFVYLVRVELNVGHVTSVDHGLWVNYHNVNREPWRFVDLLKYPEVLKLAQRSKAS
jgi:hypothetical protein